MNDTILAPTVVADPGAEVVRVIEPLAGIFGVHGVEVEGLTERFRPHLLPPPPPCPVIQVPSLGTCAGS